MMLRRPFFAVLVCAFLARWASAQTDSLNPGTQKPIRQPNVATFLERPEKVKDVQVSDATVTEQGFRVHTVESRFQSGKTKIRVLPPQQLVPGKKYPVLYILPVEASDGQRYGDGLEEARRQGLADKHGILCVAPTFSQLPWYADHPTKADVRQESYFIEVIVPLVEELYPAANAAEGRLLIGFSKSGWGAFSLCLRHPKLFGKAAAWDAPLAMEWPSKYGSADIFQTAENFEAYRIARLVERRAVLFTGPPRLVLGGYGSFRSDLEKAHQQLAERKIPHVYHDGPQRAHDWHSGWLSEYVADLLAK